MTELKSKSPYRWDKPGIPHQDWTCVDTYDMGEPEHTCQMCGNERVRYVHVMHHRESPELHTGCVCAAHMSGIPRGVYKDRERVLQSRFAMRTRWLTRKWRRSKKGNQYLKLKDHVMVVFQSPSYGGCWNGSFDGQFYNGRFNSINAAKLALFDEFWLQTKGKLGPVDRPAERVAHGR